ncbi:16802_t:CDS:2, partial [Funneliformis geosporum]
AQKSIAMVDISLNCLHVQGGEENYEFTIITNTENSVEKFKKDIKEKIKVAGEDIFNDIEADQLMLWQLNIISVAVDYTNISLQQLYNEQYIKQGNILFYNRTYKDAEFTHECEIKDIYNIRKLSVISTFANNKEKLMSIDSLTELELYILKSNDRFKNIKRATGSAYDWFFIIDKDVNKGSINELRKQYVKNKINPTG